MASSLDSNPGSETAVFANGCFWGTEHMFSKHFKGKFKDIKVGYANGHEDGPTSYRAVCSGRTGHAESVKIVFDPSVVSYAELVEFHYRMHDATTLNRQGGDTGTQYRSAVFYTSDKQNQIAHQVTKEVQEKHYGSRKIVTQVDELENWQDAEEYHQRYLQTHPGGYECPAHRLYW